MSLTYRPTPQQVTRIPPYRPGDRVRVGGRERVVRALSCALTEAEPRARWRLWLEGGGWCWAGDVEEERCASTA